MRFTWNEVQPQSLIVSFASNRETKDDLLQQGLPVLYYDGATAYVFPEEAKPVLDDVTVDFLSCCCDYDVIDLGTYGKALRCYRNDSSDNTMFITGRCNSNCVMCPDSERARRGASIARLETLLQIIRHMPSDVGHITITGGEPFLMGRDIFRLFDSLNNKFPTGSFLLLTNGRAFSIRGYAELTARTLPVGTTIGIPLHGYSEQTHDAVTQAPGSFSQTVFGIKQLLALDMSVEVRIVVSRITAPYVNKIAELVVRQLPDVACVKIMGLEMLGSARANKESVWISYPKAFSAARRAIATLVAAGIDVGLYNFPLCAVDRPYWTLCEQSITDYKVRFPEPCKECAVKDACGGVFAGSLRLAMNDFKPVR